MSSGNSQGFLNLTVMDGKTGKGTVERWKGDCCIEYIRIREQERNDDLLTSVAVSPCQ